MTPPGHPDRRSRPPAAAASLPLPFPVSGGLDLAGRLELEQSCDVAAPFDGDAWRYSVEWDGMRVIVTVGQDGAARAHDERLRDVGDAVPEAVAAAPLALRGRSAVLEGVVVLLDAQGCPDLAALWDRLRGGSPPGPPAGLVVLVTDLLALDGASTLAWPFDRRVETLVAAVEPAPHLQRPEWVAGHGVALCEAAAERGLAAVVARHSAAPYMPGLAAPQRLRIALEERTDAVVVGILGGVGGGAEIEALLLAEWHDGRLVDAGRVAADPGATPHAWLRRRASALRQDAPAVDGIADEGAVTWLHPSLVATVRHHGRRSDGRLRLPSPVALREDRPVAWCRRRAPRPAPSASSPTRSSNFRPAVLSTLPFGVRRPTS